MIFGYSLNINLILAPYDRCQSRADQYLITSVRRDRGKEFEYFDFEEFCGEYEISHNFSTPTTPQQNEVVERKNKTLIEMAMMMRCENNLAKNL